LRDLNHDLNDCFKSNDLNQSTLLVAPTSAISIDLNFDF